MASGNGSDDGKLVSLSGQPIYHYDESPPGLEAIQGEMCLEEISAHIQAHLGPIESVFHEIVSDLVHIDVHWVPPNEANPFHRLVTSGMSDLPMQVPTELDGLKHLELMVTLPPDWRVEQEAFQDEAWYWPVRLLKTLARFPHKYRTWLGWGHSMPNGDPAEPYAANTGLCGAILLPAVTAPEEFAALDIDSEKRIHFLAVVPLYREEMELKLRKGSDALLEKFGAHDISDAIDPARKNVAKKRFGLF